MAFMPRKRVLVFAFGVAVSAAAVAYWRSTNKSRIVAQRAGAAPNRSATPSAPYADAASASVPSSAVQVTVDVPSAAGDVVLAADVADIDLSDAEPAYSGSRRDEPAPADEPTVESPAGSFIADSADEAWLEAPYAPELPAADDVDMPEVSYAPELPSADDVDMPEVSYVPESSLADDTAVLLTPGPADAAVSEDAGWSPDETTAFADEHEADASSMWGLESPAPAAIEAGDAHHYAETPPAPEIAVSPSADHVEAKASGLEFVVEADTDDVATAPPAPEAPASRRVEIEDPLVAASRYAREMAAAHAAAAAAELEADGATEREVLAADDVSAPEVFITSGRLADAPQSGDDELADAIIESAYAWDGPAVPSAGAETPEDAAAPAAAEDEQASRDFSWPAPDVTLDSPNL